jgi:hypothetical protein
LRLLRPLVVLEAFEKLEAFEMLEALNVNAVELSMKVNKTS